MKCIGTNNFVVFCFLIINPTARHACCSFTHRLLASRTFYISVYVCVSMCLLCALNALCDVCCIAWRSMQVGV